MPWLYLINNSFYRITKFFKTNKTSYFLQFVYLLIRGNIKLKALYGLKYLNMYFGISLNQEFCLVKAIKFQYKVIISQ